MNSKIALSFFRSSNRLTSGCLPSITTVRHNYTHIEHAKSTQYKLSHRVIPHPKEKAPPHQPVEMPSNFREVYPEFLPSPSILHRNKLCEKLQRMDMLNRRKHIDIPEFYVGSIMAVTVSDDSATDKTNRFVGICIDRGGVGLEAWFILRNVIDHQGLEIRYEMYCPLVVSIETLRLEKRLDEHLYYLRDVDLKYSTFPQDMEADLVAEGSEVPINDMKVVLPAGPRHKQWQNMELKGIVFEGLTDAQLNVVEKSKTPHYHKYDLMTDYRATIPLEEQENIFREISPHYSSMKAAERQYRKRRKLE